MADKREKNTEAEEKKFQALKVIGGFAEMYNPLIYIAKKTNVYVSLFLSGALVSLLTVVMGWIAFAGIQESSVFWTVLGMAGVFAGVGWLYMLIMVTHTVYKESTDQSFS